MRTVRMQPSTGRLAGHVEDGVHLARLEMSDQAAGPWGSETPIRSRGRPVVLVDEPTEHLPPADVAGVDRDRPPGRYER